MEIAVVGANRGIGLEFVKNLSKEHNVTGFCRKTSKELDEAKAFQVIEGCDVADPKSVALSLEAAKAPHFDWLIHVSGIMMSTSLDNLDSEAMQKQFHINSLAPLQCVIAFRSKLASGSKVGLLTSRMGSVADNSSGGSYGYRMSKAALNMGAVSLAHDLKPSGVAVLLLHPGYVKTDMTNHTGHIETPESVAGMVRILSDKGLQETGTFWHTNGENLPW